MTVAELIEALKQQPPDAAVLAYGVPDMDGNVTLDNAYIDSPLPMDDISIDHSYHSLKTIAERKHFLKASVVIRA